MSDPKVAAILKYLVKGVRPERDAQHALQAELEESLPAHNAITVLPVVQGFSVEIEVSKMAPFTQDSFEPYVAEHILRDAVALRCRPEQDVQLQLIKASYL